MRHFVISPFIPSPYRREKEEVFFLRVQGEGGGRGYESGFRVTQSFTTFTNPPLFLSFPFFSFVFFLFRFWVFVLFRPLRVCFVAADYGFFTILHLFPFPTGSCRVLSAVFCLFVCVCFSCPSSPSPSYCSLVPPPEQPSVPWAFAPPPPSGPPPSASSALAPPPWTTRSPRTRTARPGAASWSCSTRGRDRRSTASPSTPPTGRGPRRTPSWCPGE